MKTWLLCSLLLFSALFLAPTRTQAYENPLKKANVGDWIEHKQTMTMAAGKTMEMTSKQTVLAKDEKEITMKMETTVMGRANSHEIKIPLDVPYNPATAGVARDAKAKMEVVGEGEESIKAGDKTYACHWVEMKGTTESRGKSTDMHTKVWYCKDVPVNGMVKMEMDSSSGMKMTNELTGAGTK